MTRARKPDAAKWQRIAADAIAQLGETHCLSVLARDVLKLSHGYLSRLRTGEQNPSAALAALLWLLAREPQTIEAVRELWRNTEEEGAATKTKAKWAAGT